MSSLLSEYVRLIIEKKIREADISEGDTAVWGSKKHIADLEKRLKDAEYWRDKQKKGSEKRAHYRGVVNDIKRQLASAKKAGPKTGEAIRINKKELPQIADNKINLNRFIPVIYNPLLNQKKYFFT